MLDEVKDDCLPEHALVVDCGGICLFHYKESGLSYVYLRGGIERAENPFGEEWFKFKCLREIHSRVVSELAVRKAIGPSEFTFIRKYLGLTLREFASVSGCSVETLDQWICGEGFQPDGAVDSLLRLLEMPTAELDMKLAALSDVAYLSQSA